MELASSYNISEVLTMAVLSLVALAFGVQHLIKTWKSGSTESSLLTLMHNELERMSSQNTMLSGEIGKLQIELVRLSNQLTTLTYENQKLQSEVSALNDEISRLHGLMLSQPST